MNLGGTVRLNPLGICIVIGAVVVLLVYVTSGGFKSSSWASRDGGNKVNLKALLLAAVEVAEKGGRVVWETRQQADLDIQSKGETKEGVDDPVTNADFRSHCIMYHTLSTNFPKVKVISEEHPASKCEDHPSTLDLVGVVARDLGDVWVPSEDVTIWIDPLDATKEFTENLLQYVTTMVCVAVQGRPVIGVIHRPFSNPTPSQIAKGSADGRTSWGWKDHGSSTDLQYSPSAPLRDGETLKIIVSRSHAGQVKNISEKAFGDKIEVISAAGAGYKVLEVTSHRAHVYVHTTAIKKWDICAGEAILLTVGGSLTTLRGHVLDYSAAAPALNEGGVVASLEHDQKQYVDKLAPAILTSGSKH